MSLNTNGYSKIVETYSDLIYDLCFSLTNDATSAQGLTRTIFKNLKKNAAGARYKSHLRTWVLKIASETLSKNRELTQTSPSSAERLMIDSSLSTEQRLNSIQSYLHRFSTEDQLILLFRDKLGLSYPEISSILGSPADSIRTRKQLLFKTLEEWIWET